MPKPYIPHGKGYRVPCSGPGHALGYVLRPNKVAAGHMATLARHQRVRGDIYWERIFKPEYCAGLTLAVNGTLDSLRGGLHRYMRPLTTDHRLKITTWGLNANGVAKLNRKKGV